MGQVGFAKRSADPSTAVITAAEFRTHMKRDDISTDDTLIGLYIDTAREACEDFCNRSFINTTWNYYLDEWPADSCILLPRSKVSAVAFVKYYDSNGTLQTITASNYQTDLLQEPNRIKPIPSYSWPTLGDYLNAVQIQFTAGYGTAASNVPEGIKTAMKYAVAHYSTNRTPMLGADEVSGRFGTPEQDELPEFLKAVLRRYRVKY